jgi:hypothetical protein
MESSEDPILRERVPSEEPAINTQNAGRTPPPTLDERLKEARRRRDELIKQRELEEIEREILMLEDPEPPIIPPNLNRFESDTPASSVRGSDDYNTPELQPEKLNQYYGKTVREHREWTGSAENAFRLAPRKFKQDPARIAWTVQFLRGTPATTWQNLALNSALDEFTWEEYKALLLNLIEDPENRQLDAAQRYADARQRVGQSVQEFNQYLLALESQLDEDYTPEQRRTHLWTKLVPEIRSQIQQYQDIPNTRDAIVALATRIEKTHGRKRTASTNEHSRHIKPRLDSAPTTQAPRGRGTSLNRQQSNRGNTLNPSGRDLATVECFSCGKKGHYSNRCPDNQAAIVSSMSESSQNANEKKGNGRGSSWKPRGRGS